MILHAVELSHVGPFRETVRIGPFDAGLNLLCARNETGKSTALRATARALFDKHTTRGEELKSLQPAGTDLAPRIRVEFETKAGRFLIEKTFLQAPRSVLQQWLRGAWQLVAEADAADQRMQLLLNSSLPGRGATRPEHWGLLGFLWARQGEPSAWPALDDEAVGKHIRARLARLELDPVIETLRTRLANVADGIATSTGQPRTGGAWRAAEDDLAQLEESLNALRATRAELDSAHARFQRAVATVAQLEKEHAEREVLARTLAGQAASSERLRAELETRIVELASTQEKLNAVAGDARLLAQRQTEAVQTTEALAKAEADAKTAELRLISVREKLAQREASRPQHELQLKNLRLALQRVQGLLRLRQLGVDAARLEKQAAKAAATAADLARLAAEKAKLPLLTAATVRKLESLTDTLRTQRAQLEARGIRVELTPDQDSTAVITDGEQTREEVLAAGKTARVHRPQSLELLLPGWGRIAIRSGATETKNLADDLSATESKLNAALQESGVISLEAAREIFARRKELDAQIELAQSAASEQRGEHETAEALRAAASGAAHRVEVLSASLQPTATETARSNSELEGDEAQLSAAIPAAEKTLAAADLALGELRTTERTATEAVHKATALVGEHRTRLRTLESQAADLAARYPAGIENAKTRAQVEFTQAEARFAVTKAGLPPEFERLPERNRRAATALQQLANDLQAARSERDNARGALEILGGQGIYSRETELEEKKAEAILRRDAARRNAWAARLAHTLIDHRKQAATKAVLTPLEQRLTAAFADLTGERGREVFLDDRLQIAGIGHARDASHPFDLLSQGAKEQLLLCLRIAVAQELSTTEPQVLILDDVLVNTDAVRQERILDVLSTLARQLQIIVLTCHADRYRGIGHALTLTAQKPAATGASSTMS